MTLLDRRADRAREADKEALIKEARRLRRRRWAFGSAVAALVIAAGFSGYIVISGPPSASRGSAQPPGSTAASLSSGVQASRPTRSPDLIQPTSLATLRNGNLLILDSSRDQILELRPDGDLSVFAGDGRLGFSGDGGPAPDAELHFGYFSSAGVSVTPDGSVDFLDDGNCRMRQVAPDGIIRTVIRIPLIKIGSGPDQTACPAASVAVSPTGTVYIATGSRIERLARNGRLVWVAGSGGEIVHEPTHPTPTTVAFWPISLAFDRAGNLYIGSFEPRVVYRLTTAGKLTNLGGSYPTALATASSGSVLVGTHFGVIQRATSTGTRLHLDNVVDPRHVAGIHWGTDRGFQENGIALTRRGTIYVDNAEGNGYGDGTVLVRITSGNHAALVRIRTSLTSTLPNVGASGFPIRLYPQTRPPRGTTRASCPSDTGIQSFTPSTIRSAKQIARTYLSGQFASDIAVTDRSWWTADFTYFADGGDLGRHTVVGEEPASDTPAGTGLRRACGSTLVRDSIAVSVGESGYSDFAGTLYFLDRNGHPLVYDVR